MKKHILIQSDGYSIEAMTYPSLEAAQTAMRTAYDASMPEDNDESSMEMSSCGDNDAILYRNGYEVLVWRITTCE